MVGLARHYHQFPDQLTQEQIRAYLLHLRTEAYLPFAERGHLGAAVFLSASFGLERRAAVFTAKKKDMAVAGGFEPQGSRAIAQCHGQAQRPLFTDDRLRGGAASR